MKSWNRGVPPHVGWWLTNWTGWNTTKEYWRWWDGKCWSRPFGEKAWVSHINEMIEKGLKLNTQNIRWCYEWPKNARVERVDPRLESKCL